MQNKKLGTRDPALIKNLCTTHILFLALHVFVTGKVDHQEKQRDRSSFGIYSDTI